MFEEKQRRKEQHEEDMGIEDNAEVAESGDDGPERDLHQRQRNGKGRSARDHTADDDGGSSTKAIVICSMRSPSHLTPKSYRRRCRARAFSTGIKVACEVR